MLRDAEQLCFPIHVSPSHGYTVAFKLQRGTFDFDAEVKLEACNTFETPTCFKDEGWKQGCKGASHSTSIFIHHTSGKKPGHPRGLGVCASSQSLQLQGILPPATHGWRVDY